MANKYPIVLAHGIARFDFLVQHFIKSFGSLGLDLESAADGLHYFKGIARHLRNNGFDVYHSSVRFAAGVEQRAEDLQREVSNVLSLKGASKVNIIAHSMGGLDARHMIVNRDMAEKVASLTTIGTPHMGSTFADWGEEHKGHEIMKLVSTVIDVEGFSDLTSAACKAFNDAARNSEASNKVFYQTYASADEQAQVFTPLKPSWAIIHKAEAGNDEGRNDGLVSRTSQSWEKELAGDGGAVKKITQHLFPVPADHLNEVGWWDLNQLQISDWWKTNLATHVRDYELSIRNVYLDIAKNLP
jgi:triacylglycerol lipase